MFQNNEEDRNPPIAIINDHSATNSDTQAVVNPMAWYDQQ